MTLIKWEHFRNQETELMPALGREQEGEESPALPWQRADKGEHAWDLSPGALHVYKVDVYI